jgi:hypothetical protein
MSDNSGQGAIKLLTSEYDYISKYNSDPEGLITPDENITNAQFTQNDDSTWTKVEYESKNPNELPSTVIKTETSNRDLLISQLKNVAIPLDQQIIDLNNQINSKKSLIISTLASAVSAGCSMIQFGFDILNPLVFPLIVDAADVNGTGVAIGAGLTVSQDTATISVYSNVENYSATSFLPSTNQSLSSSNVGNGYQTTVSNNNGSTVSSSYKEINVGLSAPPICATYYDTITTLANEIDSLRAQRDSINFTDLNSVKTEKSSHEVRRWGFNCRDGSISQRQSTISTSIDSINSLG